MMFAIRFHRSHDKLRAGSRLFATGRTTLADRVSNKGRGGIGGGWLSCGESARRILLALSGFDIKV